MERYRFYKTEEDKWYIDLPEWKGTQEDLQMVAGADILLDKFSNNATEVTVELSDRYKDRLNGGNYALLKLERTFTKGQGGGGDYKYQGESIWLCDVTKFIFKKFPLYIVFRVVED
jgi:hypothetical protein